MKAYITSDTTAKVVIKQALNTPYNNTIGKGGFRDEIKNVGINWAEVSKHLINDFTGVKLNDIDILLNIQTVDFEEVKKEKVVFDELTTKLSEKDYYASIKEVQVPFEEITFTTKKKK